MKLEMEFQAKIYVTRSRAASDWGKNLGKLSTLTYLVLVQFHGLSNSLEKDVALHYDEENLL